MELWNELSSTYALFSGNGGLGGIHGEPELCDSQTLGRQLRRMGWQRLWQLWWVFYP
jgi:hypothetical protein